MLDVYLGITAFTLVSLLALVAYSCLKAASEHSRLEENRMGKAERERGKRGERYVANRIRDRLGIEAHRGVQFHGGPDSPDVTGLPGYHVEVKNVNRLELHKAIKQSTEDAGEGEVPIVVHHRDREPWYVDMPFEDFLDLYAKAHGL